MEHQYDAAWYKQTLEKLDTFKMLAEYNSLISKMSLPFPSIKVFIFLYTLCIPTVKGNMTQKQRVNVFLEPVNREVYLKLTPLTLQQW